MIFDLRELDVQVLKKFDGKFNYFNPSYCSTNTIFRRETKFENKMLVSDIVDMRNNIILKHHVDDQYLWSYEDARFISDREILVCCCKRDKNDLIKIINVEYKKYNIPKKEFTHFKTQNAIFEKHWQIYNKNIIYHVNPYTIINHNEDVTYKKEINWMPWISRYGSPGLSTNVFEVYGKKYLLYHSYIPLDTLYFKYYVGILRLNDNIEPIGYYIEPLFESKKEYSDELLLNTLWEWRNVECQSVVKYEVIFPMNVVIKESHLNIFSGLNDCSCVNIRIHIDDFHNKMMNNPLIVS